MFCHPLNNDLSEDYNTRYRKINLKFEMHMKYAFQWYITLRHWQILHFYQNFGVFLPAGASFRGCNSLKWGEIVFFLISCVLIHKCFKKKWCSLGFEDMTQKMPSTPYPYFQALSIDIESLNPIWARYNLFQVFWDFLKKIGKIVLFYYFTTCWVLKVRKLRYFPVVFIQKFSIFK